MRLPALFAFAMFIVAASGCDSTQTQSNDVPLTTADARSAANLPLCWEDQYDGPLTLTLNTGIGTFTDYEVYHYSTVRSSQCGVATPNGVFRVVASGRVSNDVRKVNFHTARGTVSVNGTEVFNYFSGRRSPSQEAVVGTDTFGYTLNPGDEIVFTYTHTVNTVSGVYSEKTQYSYTY